MLSHLHTSQGRTNFITCQAALDLYLCKSASCEQTTTRPTSSYATTVGSLKEVRKYNSSNIEYCFGSKIGTKPVVEQKISMLLC